MTPSNKTYLLVVAASPVGEAFGDRVCLAAVPVTLALVERWDRYANVVRNLAATDKNACNLAAWCPVSFYDVNPFYEGDLVVEKQHPASAEVEAIVDEGDGWMLLEEEVPSGAVRTDADHVNVWGANLVFAGQAKYGSDRYESTWVRVDELLAAIRAKA